MGAATVRFALNALPPPPPRCVIQGLVLRYTSSAAAAAAPFFLINETMKLLCVYNTRAQCLLPNSPGSIMAKDATKVESRGYNACARGGQKKSARVHGSKREV